MTFGSINRSDNRNKTFHPRLISLENLSIKKTKNKPKFLKTFSKKRFLENDHKRTMMAIS